MHRILVPLAAVLVLATTAPGALAAPPSNDDRADAATLRLGQQVSGTVREATAEDRERVSCGESEATVWYRFTPPRDGDVIIQFDAGGNLDATVNVYERTRSRLDFVDCSSSDRDGEATLDLGRLDPSKDYLVQVAKELDSDAADFTLGAFVASPEARPPGDPLPARGRRDSVDRLLNPSDAYSVSLTEGVTYRVSLAARACVSLGIFGPKTRSFESGDPERVLRCGGYGLYTPERSGRFFLLVASDRDRGEERYRLRLARAKADDTTPGRFIRNDVKVRGRVDDRIDSVDLYRFDVTRPSTLTLKLQGGPDLELRRDDGRRLDSGPSIETVTKPGRYYAVVRGGGAYTLRRISRVTTRSVTRFNGRKKAGIGPGSSAALTLAVSPSVSGRGTIVVERKDPVEGWQFLHRYGVRVVNGRATITFRPPTVGRYRARSVFRGSRTASRSETDDARLNVRGPLVE